MLFNASMAVSIVVVEVAIVAFGVVALQIAKVVNAL